MKLLQKIHRSRIVRFGVVGLTNSAIDFAVFSAAIFLRVEPLLANLLGWAVAVSFSYLANSRWTFERNASLGDGRSALRFMTLGAIITLGVSTGSIWALAETLGPIFAKIAALVVAAVLNFIAARWAIENRILLIGGG